MTRRQLVLLVVLAAAIWGVLLLLGRTPTPAHGPSARSHEGAATAPADPLPGGAATLAEYIETLPAPAPAAPGCRIVAVEGNQAKQLTRVWDVCPGSDTPVARLVGDK